MTTSAIRARRLALRIELARADATYTAAERASMIARVAEYTALLEKTA